MPHSPVHRNAMVLVCDARKALLLVNQGDARRISLAVVAELEAGENPPTAAQGTDRPGRLKDGDHAVSDDPYLRKL